MPKNSRVRKWRKVNAFRNDLCFSIRTLGISAGNQFSQEWDAQMVQTADRAEGADEEKEIRVIRDIRGLSLIWLEVVMDH